MSPSIRLTKNLFHEMICKTIVTSYKFPKTSKLQLKRGQHLPQSLYRRGLPIRWQPHVTLVGNGYSLSSSLNLNGCAAPLSLLLCISLSTSLYVSPSLFIYLSLPRFPPLSLTHVSLLSRSSLSHTHTFSLSRSGARERALSHTATPNPTSPPTSLSHSQASPPPHAGTQPCRRSSTLSGENHTPQTLNPKPSSQTLNIEPRTLNPTPPTLNPRLYTLNPKP